LQAAAGTKRPEFWLHCGYKSTSPKSRSPTRNQGNQRAPDNKGLKGRLVELIWIEPTAYRASSSGRRSSRCEKDERFRCVVELMGIEPTASRVRFLTKT
jgi:hypothetical protein